MKRYSVLTLLLFSTLLSFASRYNVTGGGGIVEYTDRLGGTGLETVFILKSLSGATITYESESNAVQFYRYEQSLSDKDLITDNITKTPIGTKTRYQISNLEDSRGYLAEDPKNANGAIWIVNYQQHLPIIHSLDFVMDDNLCQSLTLMVNKSDDLFFYTNGGGRRSIPRLYTLTYQTLEWDATNEKFEQKEKIEEKLDIGTEYAMSAPLINTNFTLKGDQFGDRFGIPTSLSSVEYAAVAIEGHIVKEKEGEDVPNEVKKDDNSDGGSAPLNMNFYGKGNDLVDFYTWFIYQGKNREKLIARYTDEDISYEFLDAGTYIVELEVANSVGGCVHKSEVTISVTDSYLDIPNYFSPNDSPGSNDEFRVAYRSLVKFKCTIFNRWGNKLYEWNDPAKGWNGKYKGSYVKPGVYFYVIEALGSDGVKYKKGGDINIL